MEIKRYTQPVVETVPGPDFKLREISLFEDPEGKWVLYDDIKHLLPVTEKLQVSACPPQVQK